MLVVDIINEISPSPKNPIALAIGFFGDGLLFFRLSVTNIEPLWGS